MKTSESLSLAASHLTPSSFYHYYSNTNIAKTYRQINCRAKEEEDKKNSKHHVSIFVHTTEPAIKIKTSQKRRISEPACRTR
jgi:hypothetical protein